MCPLFLLKCNTLTIHRCSLHYFQPQLGMIQVVLCHQDGICYLVPRGQNGGLLMAYSQILVENVEVTLLSRALLVLSQSWELQFNYNFSLRNSMRISIHCATFYSIILCFESCKETHVSLIYLGSLDRNSNTWILLSTVHILLTGSNHNLTYSDEKEK